MASMPLRFGPLIDSEELYLEILQVLERLASYEGKGVFADKLGMSESFLNNALKDRARCHFKLKDFIAVVHSMDRDDLNLHRLAKAKERCLYHERPMTTEERLAIAESYIRRKYGEDGEEGLHEEYRRG